LAMLNASARKIRVAGAVMPIMLATGLATALIYMQTAQVSAAKLAYTNSLRADLVLSSGTGGFPVDFVDVVKKQPGVAAASALVPGSAYLPPTNVDPDNPTEDDRESVAALGVTATDVAAVSAISPTKGTLDGLRGNAVALSTSDAAGQGVDVGGKLKVKMGDGFEVDATVVAVYEAEPGYDTVLLPAQLVAGHTASGLVPQILIRAAPGADLGTLSTTLAGLANQAPGLRVANRDQIVAGEAEREQIGAWVNFLLVAMIVGYAVISLVNTLIIATGERRREFALQRLIGSTRGQVMRMMTVEVVLTVVAGVTLGTLVALTTLIPFSSALGTSLPGGPLWIYFAVTGTAGALTLAVTLVSTRYALRSRPAEAAASAE
jgi:putative ABC transport system permease protein